MPTFEVKKKGVGMSRDTSKMSAGTMAQETSTSWKDAHAAQDCDAVPDQVREAVNKGDEAYTLDSDDDSDTSEYYDSESNRP